MNVQGLTSDKAVGYLTHEIVRLEGRNFCIAVVAGVVLTVATIAGYVFSLIAGLPILGIAFPIATGIGNVLLLASGIPIFFMTREALEKWTIRPLRVLKEEIEGKPLDEKYLISLIDKCGCIVLESMNFSQLGMVRSHLWKRSFRKAIYNSTKEPHLKWKRVLEFEALNKSDRVKALSTNNTALTNLYKESAEVKAVIDSIMKEESK